MSVLPSTATGRIALAIGLSLLAHAIMLTAPMIELPKSEVPLPPLTAKLEPLPKLAAQPAAVKKPRPKPQTAPPKTAPDSGPDTEQPAEIPQIDKAPQPVAVETIAEEASPAHPLPKHAQLTFTAYRGSNGLLLGEAVHRLHADDGQYTVTAVTQTTGLVGIFKSYLLTQASQGDMDAQGLHPHSFNEEKKQSGNSSNLSAEFDWEARKLRFSHGDETSLPEQAQDILSFLYQLSQMPLDRKTLPLAVSNGKKLERYEVEIGVEEEIATPLGALRALPLRKIHAQGEEGLDVWLGLEYRLLPVMIRQIGRDGQIAGEMVISDIRVADE